MNRDEVRTYIKLCRDANLPARSIYKALEKKAGAMDGAARIAGAGVDLAKDMYRLLKGNPIAKASKIPVKNPRAAAVGIGLGGAAIGSAGTWYSKDQQLQDAKKEFTSIISDLADRDKKQQKEWLLRGGALGGGLGAIVAPLLVKGNPALSSLLGAAAGTALGSVGGSLYSNYLGNN